MKVRVYQGIEMDPYNLPEDFDEIIENKFKEFTYGTASEYRFEDQLHFIDNVVNYLNGNLDDDEIVDDTVIEEMEIGWREYGEFTSENDIYCREFLERCVNVGREHARLDGRFKEARKDNEAIKKMLARIIKVIFEEETK